MKKILSTIYIGILSFIFVFTGFTAFAQFGGGFSGASPWVFEDSDTVTLRDSTWDLFSSATRLVKLWVTDVDISGVLTLGGVVGSGGIDLDGNALIFDADGDTQIDSTTDDRLDIQLGPSGDNLQYSVGAFAFQEGTIISTTADALTFTPTTDSLFSNGTGVVIGHTAQITVGALLSEFQVLGTAGADSSMIVFRGSANSSPAQLFFAKGRDAIGTATTALTVNDDIANIRFYGSDGTDFGSYAAEIMVSVDAATGNNDLAGRMVFSTTADGDASPTERLRIDSAGLITITGSQTISSTLGVTGVATFSNVTTSFSGIPYGWPVDNGTASQRLTTDGTGVLSWQTVSAGANAELSNLTASTTINTNLVSDTDSTDDLGSSSIFWDETFSDEIVLFTGGMGTTATDEVRLAALDLSAGDAGLHIKTENDTEHIFASFVGIATTTPTSLFSVGGTSGSQFLVDSSGNVTVGGNILTDTAGGNNVGANGTPFNAIYVEEVFGRGDSIFRIHNNDTDGTYGESVSIFAADIANIARTSVFKIFGADASGTEGDIQFIMSTASGAAVKWIFGASQTTEYTLDINAIWPEDDSARDLGTSSQFWDETFTDEIILTNDGTAATAANTVRLGAQDLVAGDAGFLITSEDDTNYIFGSNFGMATTTPESNMVLSSTATSTFEIYSSSASQGACLKLADFDGTGFTYCVVNGGSMTCSTTSCK